VASTKSNSVRTSADALNLTALVWKEDHACVAYAPQLYISSCGSISAQARSHLREAVFLLLEEAPKQASCVVLQALDEHR
jgi:hypothetical protein